MTITLTNKLDGDVDVNFDNVELRFACNLRDKCDFFDPTNQESESKLAVRLCFTSGKSLIVKEGLQHIIERTRQHEYSR